MVETDQAGFHVSGWKSVMERHSLKKGTQSVGYALLRTPVPLQKHPGRLTLCCT